MEVFNNETVTLFTETARVEKELSGLLKKKSPTDKNITQLRLVVRDNYEKILLDDIELGSSKEVDQLLWKSVYYKPIEEFRKMIKKHHQSVNAPGQNGVDPSAKEKMHKACAALQLFIEDGDKYYDGLFQRIKQKYDACRRANNMRCAKMYLTSLSKCLVIQGDLARYLQLYNEQQTKDWSKARAHYIHALNMIPTNGNPHNQLAVLATYQSDSCEAIYRYYRSLAVKKPFSSARENLILLFEKNRQKFQALKQQEGEKEVRARSNSRSKRSDLPTKSSVQLTPGEAKQKFLTWFIRLHGILFTKTSMEIVDDVKEETMDMLEQLSTPSIMEGEVMDQDELSEDLVLKLVILNICSIQNACSQAQHKNNNPYLEKSCLIAFDTFKVLCKHSMRSLPQCAYLGSLITFLQYADQHRENTVYQFTDMAKNTLWSGLAQLLSSLPKGQFKYERILEEGGGLDANQFTNKKCPEDQELSGFLYMKNELPQSNEQPVKGAAINQVRMSRLNHIVNRLINDDRIDLYYDQRQDTYSTVDNMDKNDHSQPIDTQEQQQSSQGDRINQDDHDEDDDDDTLVSQGTNMDHFMGSTINQFIMDDNDLLGDDLTEDFDLDEISEAPATLIQNNDHHIAPINHTNSLTSSLSTTPTKNYQVIERPFGASPTNKMQWMSSSSAPTANNNLMSKLLHGKHQEPQQQQHHSYKQSSHSIFDTVFSHGAGGDGSLFASSDRDLWTPSNADQGVLSASHTLFPSPSNQSTSTSSNVIERPFQRGMNHAQAAPQTLFSSPSVGGVIESPFSSWRTGHTHQPGMEFMYHVSPSHIGYSNIVQQQQQQHRGMLPQQSPQHNKNGGNSYIP